MQAVRRPEPLRSLTPHGELFVLSVPRPTHAYTARLPLAQRQVLDAVLDGQSSEEIARQRGTSVKTVVNQLAKLFEHYDVHSRTELVRKLEQPTAAR